MIAMKSIVLLFTAALFCSLVLAQDASTTQPSDDESDRPAAAAPEPEPAAAPARARSTGRAKLTKPWSDLSTLSEEQRQQIIQIHADALEAMREIRTKEQEDIMAVLTDENKVELEELKSKQRADAKAKRAAKKEEKESAPKAEDEDDD